MTDHELERRLVPRAREVGSVGPNVSARRRQPPKEMFEDAIIETIARLKPDIEEDELRDLLASTARESRPA